MSELEGQRGKESRHFIQGKSWGGLVSLSISRLVGFFFLTPNVTLSRLLYIFVTTNVILLAFCSFFSGGLAWVA
jgi:hypothetical protein